MPLRAEVAQVHRVQAQHEPETPAVRFHRGRAQTAARRQDRLLKPAPRVRIRRRVAQAQHEPAVQRVRFLRVNVQAAALRLEVVRRQMLLAETAAADQMAAPRIEAVPLRQAMRNVHRQNVQVANDAKKCVHVGGVGFCWHW